MRAQRTFWAVLIASLVLLILAVYFLIGFATHGYRVDAQIMTKEAVASRLKPIGDLAINTSGPPGSRSGEAVYKSLCISCHAQGLAGAPKFADYSAWQARLGQGFSTLVTHAIQGFNGMPAKGGDPGLTDEEVARAVAYMGNAVGAKFTEPNTSEPSTATNNTVDSKIVGKRVYESVCIACHGTGIAGAPKLGDSSAWAPRLAKGFDKMLASATQGINAMPAKGGFTGSDEEFRAAVHYISGSPS